MILAKIYNTIQTLCDENGNLKIEEGTYWFYQ